MATSDPERLAARSWNHPDQIPPADPSSPETRLLRAIYGQCPDCDNTEPHEHEPPSPPAEIEQQKAAALAQLDRALTVRCPICLVFTGQRCRSIVTSQPYNLVHHARVLLWQKENQ